MKNIYLFYGEEEYLINNAISDILNNHSNGQVIKYDLSETSVNLLLDDASMTSLFSDTKIIIGYNANFLTSVTKKENINHDIEYLSKYIDNPNQDTIVIFIVSNDKLDKRKTIVKKMLDKVQVKLFNKLNESELITYAKKTFDKNNYQISLKALNQLIYKTGSNLYLLNLECEKLMLYKMDDKIITEQNIDEMILKYDFESDFALMDAVVKRDINTALSLYQELLKRNEEPIKIIVSLANQFRIIFQVKRLYAKGFSESQIASHLGAHPYRVSLANKVKINDKDLLRYLELLADLDENIKMGKVNKEVGLELFLLKL